MTALGVLETMTDRLLSMQNRDGGWPASIGGASSTEATATSVMALSAAGRASLRPRVNDGLVWLTRAQNADGGWPPTLAVRESSWSTGIAVIAFANLVPTSDVTVRGSQWLINQEGASFGWVGRMLWKLFAQVRTTELDPDLKGWPWIPGAFSWVEPTALGLIALKKLRRLRSEPKVADRINDGELMIYDRMCQGGGWNYGNSKTLGEVLQPFPDTTALALLALADHRQREANQQGLTVLRRTAAHARSGLALALAIVCLDEYRFDASRFRAQLAAIYDDTRFFGKTRSVALGVLALAGGARMFQVSHADPT
jgi:hypothetical protein